MSLLQHPEWHPAFETLAYVGGGIVYRAQRKKQGDALSDEYRWLIIAAAAIGALVGSRVLGLAEEYPRAGFHWQWLLQPGGKTIVGGLLGGWLAVEIAKLLLHVRSRTGDLFALPLCVGIAIGRVGCLLAGFADDTYGKATMLPWGIDLGDGVMRHPVQVYEIVFLAALGCVLWWMKKRPHVRGAVFRVFLFSYLAWRFAVDFLKPQPLIGGMNVIQWACLAGMILLALIEVAGKNRARGVVKHV